MCIMLGRLEEPQVFMNQYKRLAKWVLGYEVSLSELTKKRYLKRLQKALRQQVRHLHIHPNMLKKGETVAAYYDRTVSYRIGSSPNVLLYPGYESRPRQPKPKQPKRIKKPVLGEIRFTNGEIVSNNSPFDEVIVDWTSIIRNYTANLSPM